MRLLLSVLCLPLCAAQLDSSFVFEVATVKVSKPLPRGASFEGGPQSGDQPELFTAKGARLYDLLVLAYGAVDPQQITGPSWIQSDVYDVSAKLPPSTNKDQFQRMLQNLLTERFKLKLHHETKMLPVFELTVMKDGHKLQSPGATAPLALDGTAFPVVAPDKPSFRFTGARLAARQQSVATLIGMIRTSVNGRAIVDKTGLAGTYDYWLEFNPRPMLSQDGSAPDVFTALQTQLGLQLVDAKAPFDVVVIESGDKVPTEN